MAEPSSPKLLVIEDEPDIRRFLRMALQADGLDVIEADTLHWGRTEAAARRPDLVLLDLGLPDGDGVDFIRDLRAWSQVPVIVLSARQQERDKITALDTGADDYLVKPFGTGELMARVRAQLRRRDAAAQDRTPRVAFGDVCVDLAQRTVTRAGEPVHLTPLEYSLLTQLVAEPNRVLTHRQLLRAVWGPDHSDDAHYLRIYMAHLRGKLEAEPSRPRHLVTELGVGYRFMP